MLRQRLIRRGVSCTVASLTALLTTRDTIAVPNELSRAVMAAVMGSTSSSAVESLAASASQISKVWRVALAAVLGVVAVGGLIALDQGSSTTTKQAKTSNLPESNEVIRMPHGSEVLAIAASFDGLIAGVGSGSEVRVWKPDGTLLSRCPLPGGGAAVAFSPNGKRVAAAGYDGSVRVWDAATGNLLHTLTGHGESALAVAFSPDGSTLATAGEDGRVRLWDAVTCKSQRDLEGHTARVWGLSFSPDGHELASAGGDQTVRVWNVATGSESRRFNGLRGGAYAVEYNPSGQSVAVAADNTVLLLDARTGRELSKIGTGRTAVTWFAFSPDGRSLAYRDGKMIKLWEIASATDRFSMEMSAEPAGVAFTANGRSLVAALGEGAEIWELRKRMRSLSGSDPDALWGYLKGANAVLAFRAMDALVAEPETAVKLMKKKLLTNTDSNDQIDALIRRLDDNDFAVRDRASRELMMLGPDAGPALRRAFDESSSPEVRHRAKQLIDNLPSEQSPRQIFHETRAIEVLEKIGTPEARELLTSLAARELDTPLKREAAVALARLRKTKP